MADPSGQVAPATPCPRSSSTGSRRRGPARIVLVIAKAPEPGKAKTRLAPAVGDRGAARIAAASLLDTLDAARGVPGQATFVGWTGDLAHAERADELADALRDVTLLEQRGDELGERLAHAHAEVALAVPGAPLVQIGMDTPQVTSALLASALDPLDPETAGPDATLGLAEDGGWWALGLRDPRHADVLRQVPMSRPDTGTRTLAALRGIDVRLLPTLSDVDDIEDVESVAAQAPGTRFAVAVREELGVGEPR